MIQDDTDIIIAEDGTFMNVYQSNFHITNIDDLLVIRGIQSRQLDGLSLRANEVKKIKQLHVLIEQYLEKSTVQYVFQKNHGLFLI